MAKITCRSSIAHKDTRIPNLFIKENDNLFPKHPLCKSFYSIFATYLREIGLSHWDKAIGPAGEGIAVEPLLEVWDSFEKVVLDNLSVKVKLVSEEYIHEIYATSTR